jgi:arsenite methyltransferase
MHRYDRGNYRTRNTKAGDALISTFMGVALTVAATEDEDRRAPVAAGGGESGLVLLARNRRECRGHLHELPVVDPYERSAGIGVGQLVEHRARIITRLVSSTTETNGWLAALLGVDSLEEGAELDVHGRHAVVRDGILRVGLDASDQQADTAKMFGFKWTQEDTFTRPDYLEKTRWWLESRYGRLADAPWLKEHGPDPIVLDAGCGAGLSGREVFGPLAGRVRYLGADITPAVDAAKRRFADIDMPGTAFLQADLLDLPLAPASLDLIFSEGVLHHTDSTEGAIKALAPLLKPGGRFLFYVYRRKALIREFSDDAIRDQLQAMTPEEAWAAIEPLTKLGIALGELNVEIEVPEAVDVLGIPAGTMNLQRLFYWNIFKAYYDPEMTLGEMQHLNFDWYAPKNASRHTEEEVTAWCDEAGMDVEDVHVHLAGITVRARKR